MKKDRWCWTQFNAFLKGHFKAKGVRHVRLNAHFMLNTLFLLHGIWAQHKRCTITYSNSILHIGLACNSSSVQRSLR